MPTNISAATAEVLSSLPTSKVVDLESQNVDLWYSITARINQTAFAVRAESSNGTYQPLVEFYETDGTTLYLGLTWAPQYNHTNIVPIEDGATVLVKVARFGSAAGATATVYFYDPPRVTAPAGSMTVFADGTMPDPPGALATVIDATTGTTLQIRRDLPVTESADTLPTGELLAADFRILGLHLLGSDLTTTATITGLFSADLASMQYLLVHASSTKFFAIQQTGTFTGGPPTAAPTVWRISATGTVEDTWTLPAVTAVLAMGVSPDGNTLYYSVRATGNPSTFHIKRYDLTNDTPLTDFALELDPGDPTTVLPVPTQFGIRVLADGTITVHVAYQNIMAANLVVYKAMYSYAPDGTLLNTYAIPSGYSIDRPERAEDDPDSFFVWLKSNAPAFNARSRFQRVQASDGTILEDWEKTNVNHSDTSTGVAASGAYSLTTGALTDPFGPNTSCPATMLRSGVPPEVLITSTPPPTDLSTPPCCAPDGVTTVPVAGATGEPVVFPLLPWTSFCVGGGLVPTASAPSDGETW